MARSDAEEDDRVTQALLAEPHLQEAIERSLATYRGVVPEDVLQSMRALLEESLTTDPYAVGLIRQLKARPAPAASGEVVREDARQGGGSRGRRKGSASGGGREGGA